MRLLLHGDAEDIAYGAATVSYKCRREIAQQFGSQAIMFEARCLA